jgi:glycosyltransferase involved in cell wall biosynthesis
MRVSQVRVLHVLGKMDRGGVETWLVQLLEQVDRKKCEMDFLVHSDQPGAYDDEVRRLGAHWIVCAGVQAPVFYALKFRRALREHGPYDIVHTHVHCYSGFIALLAKSSGVHTVIVHSHNNTSKARMSRSFARMVYESAMRICICLFASGGLAVSREAGASLFGKRWSPSHQWALQHLGIDLTKFDATVDSHKIRLSLAIPDGALVIGHVGSFSYQKNHHFFVEIANEVLRREKSVRFLLVGDGPLCREIQHSVEAKGIANNFIFAGLRPNVPELLMGAMDLCLFPSLYEGLPIALLEAQAAGLRSLISDTITPEVEVVAGSIWRESLSHSAAQWAERLLELAVLSRVSPEGIESHSISVSATALFDYYAQFKSSSSVGPRSWTKRIKITR